MEKVKSENRKKNISDVYAAAIKDSEFIRGNVPMTKEEIRTISLSKLGITDGSVIFDIGAGTGSVSVTAALMCPGARVYAFEKNDEALELIRLNSDKFGVGNLETVAGDALENLKIFLSTQRFDNPESVEEPESGHGLPIPTHVFIGGSSGALSDILSAIQKKLIVKENTKEKTDKASKGVRVVINAVSLETIAQITKLIQTYPVKHVQLTQIQASRAHKLGSYNLMQAQNPVLIASFDLLPDDKIEANE